MTILKPEELCVRVQGSSYHVHLRDLSGEVVIHWGDGTSTATSVAGLKKHSYAVPGTYSVRILGSADDVALGHVNLLEVVSFGLSPLLRRVSCEGSPKLVNVPSTLSPYITQMDGCFARCPSLASHPFRKWRTANIRSMQRMFEDCPTLSLDLRSWCVPTITEEPIGFAAGSPLILPPVWGTCP